MRQVIKFPVVYTLLSSNYIPSFKPFALMLSDNDVLLRGNGLVYDIYIYTKSDYSYIYTYECTRSGFTSRQ